MILNDVQIAELCSTDKPMISPFLPELVRNAGEVKVVSMGLDSFGYSIRLDRFIMEPSPYSVFDPKDPYKTNWIKHWVDNGKSFRLNPGCMILGASVETFDMPEDMIGICLGKSTYARNALFVNVTPLEPGWKGQLTMELSNIGNMPIIVYPGEGIAQLLFFRGDKPVKNYANRTGGAGKYQDQKGITVSKI